MGIRGVWTHFRDLFTIIDPSVLQPLRISIDMFSLVYTHRTSLDELLNIIRGWSAAGHRITCVWDGTAPKEKQEIIGQRRSVRESATEKKVDLEKYLVDFKDQLTPSDVEQLTSAISSLSWQGWHLTSQSKRDIQEKLGPSIQHIFAPGEADDFLVDMAFTGKADVIVSLDSDLFVMGTPRIWRILKIKGAWIIEDILVEKVCNNWGISLATLQDASFLAGWDRCFPKGSRPMPFETALTRVKHYGTWQAVLEKNPSQIVIEPNAIDALKQIKKESRERWLQILT